MSVIEKSVTTKSKLQKWPSDLTDQKVHEERSQRFLELVKLGLGLSFLILLAIFIKKSGDHDPNKKPVTTTTSKPDPNPNLVWYTDKFPAQTVKCAAGDAIVECELYSKYSCDQPSSVDAYLFFGNTLNFSDLPLPRNNKSIWSLLMGESPMTNIALIHEKALKLFNYSATFSRYSDIPYPLRYLESLDEITSTTYFLNTSLKNSLAISPILYMETHCDTMTERDEYTKQLMEFIRVDSFGPCLNNREMFAEYTDDYIANLVEEDLLRFVGRYKFVLTIEESICSDLISGAFWRAIRAGAVPIYFGPRQMKEWIPNNKSAIFLQDYPSPRILSDYLYELLRNDKKYEEYLEHKLQRQISNEFLIEEVKRRPYQTDFLAAMDMFICDACKKVHENITTMNMVVRSHYDCAPPTSAITLTVNKESSWSHKIESSGRALDKLYDCVMNQNKKCEYQLLNASSKPVEIAH